MPYPTIEQYSEALQNPTLPLTDTVLSRGTVGKTGFGLPHALCGGFALTYTITAAGKRYAVRCFHKQSNALSTRYGAIARRIETLQSEHFLDFEYQEEGILLNRKAYPVVKMAWASGSTLGEFLEKHHRDKGKVQALSESLCALSAYLEDQQISHGDIQPGNVMVANDGRSLQLIDYDGMYVEELRGLGSAELGHRNFQHPGRTAASWNASLDRFSFIAIVLALRALETDPGLWTRTLSDGDGIVFKANDFVAPESSDVFAELYRCPQLKENAKNFAAVCRASFDKIPPLADFLAGRKIPIEPALVDRRSPTPYISTHPVLDARNYLLCLKHVGDRVELVGEIVQVKEAMTSDGKPYIFINFHDFRIDGTKITIWSEGLANLAERPDWSWIGKWVTAIGLLTRYAPRNRSYSHLEITITRSGELHVLRESEARGRLSGTMRQTPVESNNAVRRGVAVSADSVPASHPAASQNQAVLQKMKATANLGAGPHHTPAPAHLGARGPTHTAAAHALHSSAPTAPTAGGTPSSNSSGAVPPPGTQSALSTVPSVAPSSGGGIAPSSTPSSTGASGGNASGAPAPTSSAPSAYGRCLQLLLVFAAIIAVILLLGLLLGCQQGRRAGPFVGSCHCRDLPPAGAVARVQAKTAPRRVP